MSGHATTDPDSFSGSLTDAFDANAPFSLTEGAALALRADGSVTGFNQSMQERRAGARDLGDADHRRGGDGAGRALRRAKSARFAL